MKLILLASLMLMTTPFAQATAVITDKSHIGFVVKQMGVGVSGHFKRFDADITLDPDKPEAGRAEIVVDIASISTGEPDADKEALAPAWLHAADFPKARFKSSSLRAMGGERYEVKGLLTLKGKPREISVPFTLKTQADGTRVASGEFTLRRTDFGIGGGEWNEDDLVSNEVPVAFRLVLAAP
jgi:polyisoprenoid-binding protein YceI